MRTLVATRAENNIDERGKIMGRYIRDRDTLHVLGQLNHRFGEGDAIKEMAALHQEFAIFSPDHHLKRAFSLLNIGPDLSQQRRWHKFLDELHNYSSDAGTQSGHDRIVRALKKNLEAKKPLPVFFTVHAAKAHAGVRVHAATPIVFSKQKHVVISIPTKPAKAAKAAAKRGRKGRAK
jgi:hypothetical protein